MRDVLDGAMDVYERRTPENPYARFDFFVLCTAHMVMALVELHPDAATDYLAELVGKGPHGHFDHAVAALRQAWDTRVLAASVPQEAAE